MDGTDDALMAKVTSMVCLFAISMLVGCVPLLISLKFDWFTKSAGGDLRSNRLVMGLLAFGGGVLFSTTFMHLLPEIDENIELLQETGELSELPLYLAGFIMCSGFFMMYLIEELVHMYIDSRGKPGESLSRTFSVRKSIPDGTPAEDQMKTVVKDVECSKNSGHSHLVPDTADEDSVTAALRGLLIVLALSIHELFEGLAVGLESSVANVWFMFGAVSAHKYIIAFCIGVELLAANTKRWLSIVYIFTYSFMSALGIGVGILLVGGAGAAEAGLYSVILQGIACGTLVYVVFFEVWKGASGLMQYVCAIVGFILMVALEVAVELAF